MPRSKSIPGSRSSRSNTGNKEQSDAGNQASVADVKAVAAETVSTQSPESRVAAETKVSPGVKAAPEARKLEVVKNDSRKNVVPINVEDEIRRRAYELYQQRGSTPGNEAEDWLAAEREVRQRYRQQSA